MADPHTPGSAAADTALAALRRSPLAHLTERMREAAVPGPHAVALSELPFHTMVNVRVSPGSAPAARLEEALGAPLPDRCGATADTGGHTAVWLGPDEWLIFSTTSEPATLTSELATALGDDPGLVVDVSANRTTLELTGPGARQVLEKGCALDLHPRSIGPGEAYSTLLGPVPLLLWQTSDTPLTYRLLPRSSFADYIARWLLDAMTEHAVPVPQTH